MSTALHVPTTTSTDQEDPKHTLFLGSKRSIAQFDAAAHFDTPAALLSRTFNRPRTAQLKDFPQQPGHEKARGDRLRELASRLKRAEGLTKVAGELKVQKDCEGKGKKYKCRTDERGLAVYKWRQERKR